MRNRSIFEEYYSDNEFYDRYPDDIDRAVTVIIPTVHTNELWEANLRSIYREIPVKCLLIGDGGCVDDTVALAKNFPRVFIHDHREIKSLGYSIRKLIEAVDTDWFVYLHSDVYLPEGWFDEMHRHQGEYDWYGCRMRQTIMVEFDCDYGVRPYAGSQMGKKSAFSDGLSRIEDDFVYRQEDFVFSDIVAKGGFREGKLDDVFHYHQMIKKTSPFWNPSEVKVNISQKLTREEEIRTWSTQAKGIIKYLLPTSQWLIDDASFGVYRLLELNYVAQKEIYLWIGGVSPAWLPIIKRNVFRLRLKAIARQAFDACKNRFRFFIK